MKKQRYFMEFKKKFNFTIAQVYEFSLKYITKRNLSQDEMDNIKYKFNNDTFIVTYASGEVKDMSEQWKEFLKNEKTDMLSQ